MTEAYVQALRAIDALGVRFASIGTFGLHLHGLLPDDYALHDVDIVMELDAPGIARCCEYLSTDEWQLLLWDEPIRQRPSLETLVEKYYLRARKDSLCIDMVFGGLPVSNAELLTRAQRLADIPVATAADILKLKRYRGNPMDLVLLSRLGMT